MNPGYVFQEQEIHLLPSHGPAFPCNFSFILRSSHWNWEGIRVHGCLSDRHVSLVREKTQGCETREEDDSWQPAFGG